MARRSGNQPGNVDTDLHAAQREGQAFSLRAQGYDFDAIAERCGYANRGGAYKAYKRALARIPKRTVEEMRENILGLQLYALVAMAPRLAKGDTFAVREMTAIHDRMAKLFGLDTPVVADAQLAAKVVVRAYPPEWLSALPPADAPAVEQSQQQPQAQPQGGEA